MSINLVQNLNVEVDSEELLEQYLELALPTVLDSIEEIAVKIIDHDDKYKQLCYPSAIYDAKGILPVILIEGWYTTNEKKSFFNGYKPWKLFNGKNALADSIKYIMTVLDKNQSDLTDRFISDCGDGYNYGFSNYDGTVDIGYKLISNHTFPNSLSVSLTHIYYGK